MLLPFYFLNYTSHKVSLSLNKYFYRLKAVVRVDKWVRQRVGRLDCQRLIVFVIVYFYSLMHVRVFGWSFPHSLTMPNPAPLLCAEADHRLYGRLGFMGSSMHAHSGARWSVGTTDVCLPFTPLPLLLWHDHVHESSLWLWCTINFPCCWKPRWVAQSSTCTLHCFVTLPPFFTDRRPQSQFGMSSASHLTMSWLSPCL